MPCQKRLHLVWIRLAGFGVGCRRQNQLIKRRGSAGRNDRQVDHRGSPQLAVGEGKLKCQAAHRFRHVRGIRLSARQGEAADDGQAPGSKDDRLRETDAIAIAFEEPGDAQPLGMIATEAGVDSIDVLESVGKPSGGKLIRSEPPAEIGERSCDRPKSGTDQCEPCQRADRAEPGPRSFCWCFKVVRHLPLQSI